jgi:5-phospho-D-xylono-1,4-lactonase
VIDLLTAAGLAPERIVLAHMDRNPDAEWHVELLKRGVSLVYDTPGRIKYRPDSVLLSLVERLVDEGHGGQLLLGLDLGQRGYFRSYGGGPGLRYLLGVFAPRLRRRIGDDAVQRVLVDNPARAYAIA